MPRDGQFGPISIDRARLPLGNVRRLGEVDPPEVTPEQAAAAHEERVRMLRRRMRRASPC